MPSGQDSYLVRREDIQAIVQEFGDSAEPRFPRREPGCRGAQFHGDSVELAGAKGSVDTGFALSFLPRLALMTASPAGGTP
jgi:hypothetical protein